MKRAGGEEASPFESWMRDKHGNRVSPDGLVVCPLASFFSRLLYANPVCLLSTESNIMTISWLTAINNKVSPFTSIITPNQAGKLYLFHEQEALYGIATFREAESRLICCLSPVRSDSLVLSIPVSGMEDLVTNIGSCHGDESFSFFRVLF